MSDPTYRTADRTERNLIPTPERIGEDVCAVLRTIFTELERNRRGIDALTEQVALLDRQPLRYTGTGYEACPACNGRGTIDGETACEQCKGFGLLVSEAHSVKAP